jgi:osmoprotectant transport system permease protein
MSLRKLLVATIVWLLLPGGATTAYAQQPPKAVVAGSKRFTESYILGEVVCRTLVAAGTPCEHRQGLGNTGILEQALAADAVQVYAEYTGTIVREILKRDGNPSLDELNQWLAPRGLRVAVPLGFNNTYALGMREADAQRLGVLRVSDLTKLAPDALRLGLSHEFLTRADGWPALKAAYALPFVPGSGLDHGLAYEALKGGQVDVIDVYSTDAKIGRYGVRVLQDDRGFFPKYDAVLLMRAALDDAPLRKLAGRIDERTMIAMNAEVELDGKTFADVAKRFVDDGGAAAVGARAASGGASAAAPAGATASTGAGAATARPTFLQRLFAPDLARLTLQHLLLVFGSLALAVVAAVPLGIWAWRRPRAAPWVLGAVGIAQTLPSLALLAFLIAAVGRIGFVPALIALFVYALLPIVRNTHAGLASVPQGLPVAGRALGLNDAQVLREVELPLALPTLLAGVKTAAVINVGTATVAAFIGAGGYGERIVSGLAVNDNATMLAGAVPAAVLALIVQVVFDALERQLTRRAAPDRA